MKRCAIGHSLTVMRSLVDDVRIHSCYIGLCRSLMYSVLFPFSPHWSNEKKNVFENFLGVSSSMESYDCCWPWLTRVVIEFRIFARCWVCIRAWIRSVVSWNFVESWRNWCNDRFGSWWIKLIKSTRWTLARRHSYSSARTLSAAPFVPGDGECPSARSSSSKCE